MKEKIHYPLYKGGKKVYISYAKHKNWVIPVCNQAINTVRWSKFKKDITCKNCLKSMRGF